MATRFRSSDAAGVELPWQSIDDILDALEDGRLAAEDYVFDSVRQAWQPIRQHSELVEAWDRRMSYRPPEHRRTLAAARRPAEGFPALSPEGATPASSPAVSRIEAERRVAAHAAARVDVEEIPAVRRAIAFGEIVFAVVVLGLLAAGLIVMLRAMMAIAARPL